MERLYGEVNVGTPGELVYEPVKVAVTDEGNIFLEVDPDVYRKTKSLMEEAIDRIDALHVASQVDWGKVIKIVHDQAGNAEDIAFLPPSPEASAPSPE
jgi:L,D-transpeptidase ErfK/SrfK